MSRNDLPSTDVASRLTILGDAVSKRVVDALAGTGLRHGHGYLIQRLVVAPATATEMAAELGITQQAVSRTINELAALGHVELMTDPADSRRRPARLTPRGRAAVAQARRSRRSIDDRIRAAFGDERFDRLAAELDEVLGLLGLHEDVARRVVRPPTDVLA